LSSVIFKKKINKYLCLKKKKKNSLLNKFKKKKKIDSQDRLTFTFKKII